MQDLVIRNRIYVDVADVTGLATNQILMEGYN